MRLYNIQYIRSLWSSILFKLLKTNKILSTLHMYVRLCKQNKYHIGLVTLLRKFLMEPSI